VQLGTLEWLSSLLGSHYEGRETGEGFCQSQEGVSEKLGCRATVVDIYFQALVQEILEDRRELRLVLDVGFAICGNQVESLQGDNDDIDTSYTGEDVQDRRYVGRCIRQNIQGNMYKKEYTREDIQDRRYEGRCTRQKI